MRIDRWLELKRTKAFCLSLALLFAGQQAVWGADVNLVQTLRLSAEQQRQLDVARSAAVLTLYEDLYSRTPTSQELKEALNFLRSSPQLAYLIERLADSPESRWRLRQLNPARIQQRKEAARRIAESVSVMVGDFLRQLPVPTPSTVDVAPGLRVQLAQGLAEPLTAPAIDSLEAWLRQPETLCSNCAPNALAPLLETVGIAVSRETLTAQAVLADYLSGHLATREMASAQKSELRSQKSEERFSGVLYISMDTVQRLAAAYGLPLNAVELTPDEFLLLRHPFIAALDLTQDGEADHYVVVQQVNESRVIYRESDGTRESLPTQEFLRLFTRFALLPPAEAYGMALGAGRAQAIAGGDSWWDKIRHPSRIYEPIGNAIIHPSRIYEPVGNWANTWGTGRGFQNSWNSWGWTDNVLHPSQLYRPVFHAALDQPGRPYTAQFNDLRHPSHLYRPVTRPTMQAIHATGGWAGRNFSTTGLLNIRNSTVGTPAVNGRGGRGILGWTDRNLSPTGLSHVAGHMGGNFAYTWTRGNTWSSTWNEGRGPFQPVRAVGGWAGRNFSTNGLSNIGGSTGKWSGDHWRILAGGVMVVAGVACTVATVGICGGVIATSMAVGVTAGGVAMTHRDLAITTGNRGPIFGSRYSKFFAPDARNPSAVNDVLIIGTSLIPGAGAAGRAVVMQGGRELAIQGGRELAVQGGRELAMQGGRELAMQGGRDLATQGVRGVATREGWTISERVGARALQVFGERGASLAGSQFVSRQVGRALIGGSVGAIAYPHFTTGGYTVSNITKGAFLGATLTVTAAGASGFMLKPEAQTAIGRTLIGSMTNKVATQRLVGSTVMVAGTMATREAVFRGAQWMGQSNLPGHQLAAETLNAIGVGLDVGIARKMGGWSYPLGINNPAGVSQNSVFRKPVFGGTIPFISTLTVADVAVLGGGLSRRFQVEQGAIKQGVQGSWQNIRSMVGTKGWAEFGKAWGQIAKTSLSMPALAAVSTQVSTLTNSFWIPRVGSKSQQWLMAQTLGAFDPRAVRNPNQLGIGSNRIGSANVFVNQLLFNYTNRKQFLMLAGFGALLYPLAPAMEGLVARTPLVGPRMKLMSDVPEAIASRMSGRIAGSRMTERILQTVVEEGLTENVASLGINPAIQALHLPYGRGVSEVIQEGFGGGGAGSVNATHAHVENMVGQVGSRAGLNLTQTHQVEITNRLMAHLDAGRLMTPTVIRTTFKEVTGSNVSAKLSLHNIRPLLEATHATTPFAFTRVVHDALRASSVNLTVSQQRLIAQALYQQMHAAPAQAVSSTMLNAAFRSAGLQVPGNAALRQLSQTLPAAQLRATLSQQAGTPTLGHAQAMTRLELQRTIGILPGLGVQAPAINRLQTFLSALDGLSAAKGLNRQLRYLDVLHRSSSALGFNLPALMAARQAMSETRQPIRQTDFVARRIEAQFNDALAQGLGIRGPSRLTGVSAQVREFGLRAAPVLAKVAAVGLVGLGVLTATSGTAHALDPGTAGRTLVQNPLLPAGLFAGSGAGLMAVARRVARVDASRAPPAGMASASTGRPTVDVARFRQELFIAPAATGRATATPSATPALLVRAVEHTMTANGITLASPADYRSVAHAIAEQVHQNPLAPLNVQAIHNLIQPLQAKGALPVTAAHLSQVLQPVHQVAVASNVTAPTILVQAVAQTFSQHGIHLTTPEARVLAGAINLQVHANPASPIAPAMVQGVLQTIRPSLTRSVPAQALSPLRTIAQVGAQPSRVPATFSRAVAAAFHLDQATARQVAPPLLMLLRDARGLTAAQVHDVMRVLPGTANAAPPTRAIVGVLNAVANSTPAPRSFVAAVATQLGVSHATAAQVAPRLLEFARSSAAPLSVSQVHQVLLAVNAPAPRPSIAAVQGIQAAAATASRVQQPAYAVAPTAPAQHGVSTTPASVTSPAAHPAAVAPATPIVPSAPLATTPSQPVSATTTPGARPAVEPILRTMFPGAPDVMITPAVSALRALPDVHPDTVRTALVRAGLTPNRAQLTQIVSGLQPVRSTPTVPTVTGTPVAPPAATLPRVAATQPATVPAAPQRSGGGTAHLLLDGARPHFDRLVERGTPIQIYGQTSFRALERDGLGPKHQVKFGADTYYFSHPFIDAGGRTVFVMYLHHVDSTTGRPVIFVNAVYRSNSQNVWRAASSSPDGRYIGKGLGETSQMLPVELQGHLERMVSHQQVGGGLHEIPGRFYHVLGEDERTPLVTLLNVRQLPNTPKVIVAREDTSRHMDPHVANHHFIFTPGYEPNFHHGVVHNFTTENPIYGMVSSYVVRSTNGALQYLFNVDRAGRVWIGGVQTTSVALNRQGVRVDRVTVPDALLTPAFEYLRQMPRGYEVGPLHMKERMHPTDSHYADATPFLNQLGVIQDFRRYVLGEGGSLGFGVAPRGPTPGPTPGPAPMGPAPALPHAPPISAGPVTPTSLGTAPLPGVMQVSQANARLASAVRTVLISAGIPLTVPQAQMLTSALQAHVAQGTPFTPQLVHETLQTIVPSAPAVLTAPSVRVLEAALRAPASPVMTSAVRTLLTNAGVALNAPQARTVTSALQMAVATGVSLTPQFVHDTIRAVAPSAPATLTAPAIRTLETVFRSPASPALTSAVRTVLATAGVPLTATQTRLVTSQLHAQVAQGLPLTPQLVHEAIMTVAPNVPAAVTAPAVRTIEAALRVPASPTMTTAVRAVFTNAGMSLSVPQARTLTSALQAVVAQGVPLTPQLVHETVQTIVPNAPAALTAPAIRTLETTLRAPASRAATPASTPAVSAPVARGTVLRLDPAQFATPRAAIAAFEAHHGVKLNDVQRTAIQNIYAKLGSGVEGVRHIELAPTGVGKTYVILDVLPKVREIDAAAGRKTVILTNTNTNAQTLRNDITRAYGTQLGSIGVISEGMPHTEIAQVFATHDVVVATHQAFSGAVAVQQAQTAQAPQGRAAAPMAPIIPLHQLGTGIVDEVDAAFTIPATSIGTSLTPARGIELRYWQQLANRTEVLAPRAQAVAVRAAVHEALPKVVADATPAQIGAMASALRTATGTMTAPLVLQAAKTAGLSLNSRQAERLTTDLNRQVPQRMDRLMTQTATQLVRQFEGLPYTAAQVREHVLNAMAAQQLQVGRDYVVRPEGIGVVNVGTAVMGQVSMDELPQHLASGLRTAGGDAASIQRVVTGIQQLPKTVDVTDRAAVVSAVRAQIAQQAPTLAPRVINDLIRQMPMTGGLQLPAGQMQVLEVKHGLEVHQPMAHTYISTSVEALKQFQNVIGLSGTHSAAVQSLTSRPDLGFTIGGTGTRTPYGEWHLAQTMGEKIRMAQRQGSQQPNTLNITLTANSYDGRIFARALTRMGVDAAQVRFIGPTTPVARIEAMTAELDVPVAAASTPRWVVADANLLGRGTDLKAPWAQHVNLFMVDPQKMTETQTVQGAGRIAGNRFTQVAPADKQVHYLVDVQTLQQQRAFRADPGFATAHLQAQMTGFAPEASHQLLASVQALIPKVQATNEQQVIARAGEAVRLAPQAAAPMAEAVRGPPATVTQLVRLLEPHVAPAAVQSLRSAFTAPGAGLTLTHAGRPTDHLSDHGRDVAFTVVQLLNLPATDYLSLAHFMGMAQAPAPIDAPTHAFALAQRLVAERVIPSGPSGGELIGRLAATTRTLVLLGPSVRQTPSVAALSQALQGRPVDSARFFSGLLAPKAAQPLVRTVARLERAEQRLQAAEQRLHALAQQPAPGRWSQTLATFQMQRAERAVERSQPSLGRLQQIARTAGVPPEQAGRFIQVLAPTLTTAQMAVVADQLRVLSHVPRAERIRVPELMSVATGQAVAPPRHGMSWAATVTAARHGLQKTAVDGEVLQAAAALYAVRSGRAAANVSPVLRYAPFGISALFVPPSAPLIVASQTVQMVRAGVRDLRQWSSLSLRERVGAVAKVGLGVALPVTAILLPVVGLPAGAALFGVSLAHPVTALVGSSYVARLAAFTAPSFAVAVLGKLSGGAQSAPALQTRIQQTMGQYAQAVRGPLRQEPAAYRALADLRGLSMAVANRDVTPAQATQRLGAIAGELRALQTQPAGTRAASPSPTPWPAGLSVWNLVRMYALRHELQVPKTAASGEYVAALKSLTTHVLQSAGPTVRITTGGGKTYELDRAELRHRLNHALVDTLVHPEIRTLISDLNQAEVRSQRAQTPQAKADVTKAVNALVAKVHTDPVMTWAVLQTVHLDGSIYIAPEVEVDLARKLLVNAAIPLTTQRALAREFLGDVQRSLAVMQPGTPDYRRLAGIAQTVNDAMSVRQLPVALTRSFAATVNQSPLHAVNGELARWGQTLRAARLNTIEVVRAHPWILALGPVLAGTALGLHAAGLLPAGGGGGGAGGGAGGGGGGGGAGGRWSPSATRTL